ncbi:DcrB-related protein [Brenneria tiliae]|uniref:DcrB-related protein n=1 Tax=Brenneria tiliae TaxID=2914984 RepID=UPI00201496F2|nr:DcrB-related protein [Brenneria tiliae]MCL2899249.1 DcrB-related protein [Brenneria tiliae]MCL2903627.1 DcrB-related protein [Brenneria tiliae]
MLKTVGKLFVIGWLIGGLSACDNPSDNNKPDPQPTPPPLQAPENKPVAPVEPPAAPEAPAHKISLQKGKISFMLPDAFSDQTPPDDVNNGDAGKTHLFINSASRQQVVFSVVPPPAGQILRATEAGLESLGNDIFTNMQGQYQHIKRIRQQPVTIGKLPLQRMDNELQVGGQPVNSMLLYAVWQKKIVTLQINTPANRGDIHQALIEQVLASLNFT